MKIVILQHHKSNLAILASYTVRQVSLKVQTKVCSGSCSASDPGLRLLGELAESEGLCSYVSVSCLLREKAWSSSFPCGPVGDSVALCQGNRPFSQFAPTPYKGAATRPAMAPPTASAQEHSR